MRKEIMAEMSAEQMGDYARLIGVNASGGKSLIEEIEEARAHVAVIDLLGAEFTVPIKRMHDKRITDVLAKRSLSDRQAEQLMQDILGKAQYKSLLERCTDDDGTIDTDALGVALNALITSEQLKNF
jgi:hypothetical protein